jgi:hypothetical protein
MTLEPCQLKLRKIIQTAAPVLGVSFADPLRVLGALAEVESSFALCNRPRHERAFDFGGRYANEELCKRWGAWAACSYSSFQIMFPVAVELGFDPKRSPVDLWDDEIAIHFVVEYIRKRILARGITKIENLASVYNTGMPCDLHAVRPIYVDRFLKAYDAVEIKYGLRDQ